MGDRRSGAAADGGRNDHARCQLALLLNVLSLALFRPFGYGLAEHGHELADAALGEARVAAEVALGAELHGGSLSILEDLWRGAGLEEGETRRERS